MTTKYTATALVRYESADGKFLRLEHETFTEEDPATARDYAALWIDTLDRQTLAGRVQHPKGLRIMDVALSAVRAA